MDQQVSFAQQRVVSKFEGPLFMRVISVSLLIWLFVPTCGEPYIQKYKSTKVQEYKSKRVQEYKITRLQEYKSTRVQEYKSTKVQEYKRIRAQEHKSRKAR